MECYLRYKEISYDRLELTVKEYNELISIYTGNEQMPQLYDQRDHITNTNSSSISDNNINRRWLRDTTYIIEYLERDERISQSSLPVLPDCEVQG